MYCVLFSAPYLALVCGWLIAARWSSGGKRAIVPLIAGALVAAVVLWPVGKAYFGAREVVGERPADAVAVGSATLWNYLGPPEANALFGSALKRFADPERRLFPGFIAIVLAIVGTIVRSPRNRENTKPDESFFVLSCFRGRSIQ